mmetsp:Transcript_3109/g.9089  ORF Transcript_3109/g.9089 Transcript_3109/m.9089 type:complete len:89 (-) Transcript_3109:39-305(-)
MVVALFAGLRLRRQPGVDSCGRAARRGDQQRLPDVWAAARCRVRRRTARVVAVQGLAGSVSEGHAGALWTNYASDRVYGDAWRLRKDT